MQDYFKVKSGLSKEIIAQISDQKQEPSWMTDLRLKAFDTFLSKPLPSWGPDLSMLDFELICCYSKPFVKQATSWHELSCEVCESFACANLPQAEKSCLAGVGAQYESEMVYKNLRQNLTAQGVIFVDTDTALRKYPELFKKYFGQLVPPSDNKFAALNAAFWSGGSFLYVPPGIHVELPLQTYFTINSAQLGQFERTIIIADTGSSVEYIEGCSAQKYNGVSLHAGVVELYAHEDAHIRYTTIQNWSPTIYNLVTKRAVAYRHGTVEWIDGNFGSGITMKYPSVILKEEGAKGLLVSLSTAGKCQVQDTGGSMIHQASKTRSHIVSKSLSEDGGQALFRGTVCCKPGIEDAKAFMQCDSLILDNESRAQSIPKIDAESDKVSISHEASIGAIDKEQLFYCMSRGLNVQEARALIIGGFIDAFVKELPMEYAIEINRLISKDL